MHKQLTRLAALSAAALLALAALAPAAFAQADSCPPLSNTITAAQDIEYAYRADGGGGTPEIQEALDIFNGDVTPNCYGGIMPAVSDGDLAVIAYLTGQ